MKVKVYSVYDCKVEAYMAPFFLRNKGEAIRAFVEAANDGKHSIGKYPEDYTLFELGTWDELTGVLDMYEAKVSLGTAHEFLKRGPGQLKVAGEDA